MNPNKSSSRHHYIKSFSIIDPFLIITVFTDGVKKKYDVKKILSREMFEIFKTEPTFFKAAKLEPKGIAISWSDDVDISADELYFGGEDIQEMYDHNF